MPHAKFDGHSAQGAHSAAFLQRLRTQFYSSQAEAAAAMRAISHSKYPSEKLVREVESGRMEATWQYKMLLQLATGVVVVNEVERSDTDVQPFVDLEAQMVEYRTVIVEKEVPMRPRPKSPRRPTRPYTPRPVTTAEQEQRRAALDVTWRDVIEAGLWAMEFMDKSGMNEDAIEYVSEWWLARVRERTFINDEALEQKGAG